MEVNLKFNKIFRDANESKCRYKLIYGGAGSGKSYNIAQDFIVKMIGRKYIGANLLVIRKSNHSHRHSTFNELINAIDRIFGAHVDKFWKINHNDMTIQSKVTGNSIIFRGVNDSNQTEKIKSVSFPSGKLTWIWIEETTEISENDFNILNERLRGILENKSLFYQITMSFNPTNSSHWIKSRFFHNPNPDVFISKSTYKDNKFIDTDYKNVMEVRKERDPDGYRVYALGEWGGTNGLIIPNFEVVRPKPDLYDFHFDQVCYGQDFGYNHANVILKVGFKENIIHILDEIYIKFKDTVEIIEIAKSRNVRQDIIMYCDSAEPDRINMWRKSGYKAIPVKKEAGSIKEQIVFLRSRKIIVNSNCTNLISELNNWKYQFDSLSNTYFDTPESKNDDAIAALRYSIESFRRAKIYNFR